MSGSCSKTVVLQFGTTTPTVSERELLVDQQTEGLFDTIESAHQYVQLLGEVVSDVRKDLEEEAGGAQGSQVPRRLDAVRLALYKLDKLHLHMKAASRILNDL